MCSVLCGAVLRLASSRPCVTGGLSTVSTARPWRRLGGPARAWSRPWPGACYPLCAFFFFLSSRSRACFLWVWILTGVTSPVPILTAVIFVSFLSLSFSVVFTAFITGVIVCVFLFTGVISSTGNLHGRDPFPGTVHSFVLQKCFIKYVLCYMYM